MTHEAPGYQVVGNDYYGRNEKIMRKLKSKSPVKNIYESNMEQPGNCRK